MIFKRVRIFAKPPENFAFQLNCQISFAFFFAIGFHTGCSNSRVIGGLRAIFSCVFNYATSQAQQAGDMKDRFRQYLIDCFKLPFVRSPCKNKVVRGIAAVAKWRLRNSKAMASCGAFVAVNLNLRCWTKIENVLALRRENWTTDTCVTDLIKLFFSVWCKFSTSND